jgi:hypothetical protein
MKYLLILFISLRALAQDTIQADIMPIKLEPENTRVVVKTEGLPNVVYRGINNKINVAVAGVPDSNVSIAAPGSFKHSGTPGIFEWNVTTVSDKTATLTVSARLPNGERKVEQIEFEIRNVPPLFMTIDGKGCMGCIVELTKEELTEATVGIGIADYNLQYIQMRAKGFNISFSEKETGLIVYGNKMNEEAKEKIVKLKKGKIVYLNQGYTDMDIKIVQLKSIIVE